MSNATNAPVDGADVKTIQNGPSSVRIGFHADLQAAGDPQAAVRYLLRILECNPYDEATHLSLVVNLQAVGHHGEARRSYRAYVARMQESTSRPSPCRMPERRWQRDPVRAALEADTRLLLV